MTELKLENLRRQAERWHKVLRVAREADKFVISIVRGVGLAEGQVISEQFHVHAAPEIEEYLGRPDFQRKLFRPSKRGIVLVDVAGYSRYDTLGQSAILTMFYDSLELAEFSNDLFSGQPSIDQIVPTGDGCFIVFQPEVSEEVFKSVCSIHASFCSHQKRLLKKHRTAAKGPVLGIRLACDIGEVDFIVDAAGNRNAYGTGLNETARLLQYGRAALKKRIGGQDPVSVAFYGAELREQAESLAAYFRTLPDVKVSSMDLGKVATKHDRELELRCLVDLPGHILFPMNASIPKAKVVTETS